MAKIIVFRNEFSNYIPPDETLYLTLGPDNRFQDGAITVTAHPYPTAISASRRYMEVIQMATRFSNQNPDAGFWLDIVVRNNGHAGAGADGIDGFSVYASVILRDQD
jgi:hypothetical protein